MLSEITSLGISKSEAKELIKVSKNLEKDIEKLKTGYPIQYLIGYSDFLGYKILINESVLIPRYETEYLVERTIYHLNKLGINNPKTLDLCTGSGCISVALSKELNLKHVLATDISRKSLEIANSNFSSHKLKIKTLNTDMFQNINDTFDLIISNPPYVSKDEVLSQTVLYEPNEALFSDNNGTLHIENIINNLNSHTNNKALAAIEINSFSEDYLVNILNNALNEQYKYIFENDLSGKQRYLFIFRNAE